MLRHPPDILITTPESLYLMLTSQAREIFDGHRVGDRRRDPRRRADQARRAPRAHARAARRAGRAATCSASACRRRRTRSRRSAASWSARSARARSSTPACASRSTCRSTCRSSRWSSRSSGRRVDARPARRRRGDAQVDLAGDLPRAARARRGAPLDDRLRQQPPRRRAARAAAQRAAPTEPRSPAPTTARWRARSGWSSRSSSRPASCRAWWRPRSLELGIDMGAVDLVLQVESPKSVTARAAAHRPRRPRRRRRLQGPHLPQVPRRPARVRGRRQAHARGADRDDGRAAQPARRARPADRRDGRPPPRTAGLHVDDLHALVTPHALLRRALARAARERARHARRPLPDARSSASCAPRIVWDRVAGHDPRAQGRPRAGDHQRRHDPRPRPVLRQPARRPPRRRARRGDGLRGAPGPDFLLGASTWRIEEITRDRVIVTPAPGVPGAVPFWKGDGVGRPRELGEAIGAFARWAVEQDAETLERDYDLDPLRRAATCSTSCASSRRPRAWCRATARSSSSASATRSATGALCVLSPVRRPRARRLGPRAERPHPRRVRPRVRRDLVRRRDHRPPARRRRAARRRARPDRPRRARGRASSASSAARRCSARASARTPAARC